MKKDLAHLVTLPTTADAEDWFVDAKERLLDVNNWKKYGHAMNVDFHLKDTHAKDINRHNGRKGDLIKITGSNTDYWLVIDAIIYDDYPDIDIETFSLHVRTLADPLQSHTDDTGTRVALVIDRKAKHIIANYHGRVAADGNDDTVFASGEWLGLTFDQWHSLIKGFVSDI